MIPRQPLSRRTALTTAFGAAGLAAAAAAGCSVRVPGRASPTPTTPTPTPRPGRTTPDEQIVVDLVSRLRQSVTLLQDTRTRHPALAPRVAPLLSAQKSHLDVLLRAAPVSRAAEQQPAAIVVPTRAPKALAKVQERTRVLRDECYTMAGRAESGTFARLLAGMGAALSQRLAVTKPPPAKGVRLTPADTTGIDSMQATLAGEHAAVYVFGVLGAQTSESDQPKLWADLDAAFSWHRAVRDALVAGITAAHVPPVAAAPSYRLPNAAGNAEQVTRAALVTERRVTDTYGTLVAETAGGRRRWAIRSLDESAVRQLRFRGRPEIFPGTGGLANQPL